MDALLPGLFTAFLLPVMLLGAVPIFIYVYAILRWRAGSREEPGIGSYSLVLMFRLISVLVGLSAFAMLLYAAMSDKDTEELTRICWPLLVASLAFLAVQFVVGAALGPADRFPEARRIFGGGLVAISGIITFVVLAGLLVTLWEDVPDEAGSVGAKNHADQLKGFGAWLLCYGAAYLASAVKMALPVGQRAMRTPRTDAPAP